MRISPLNYIFRSFSKNKTIFNNTKTHSFEGVFQDTFNKEYKLSYSDFYEKMRNNYPGMDFNHLARLTIKDDSNLIGSGASSKVFKIPLIDDYAIKVSRLYRKIIKYVPVNFSLRPCYDYFPSKNFGQAILKDGDAIAVLKKVEGEQYSFYKFYNKNPEEKIEAVKKFQDDINMIASYPLESYVNFAKKLKYINDNTSVYVFDYLNHNNLLIAKDKKEINIVDLTRPEELITIDYYKSNCTHMIFSLLQFPFFKSFSKWISEEEAEKLDINARKIIKKCIEGAKIAGLDEPTSLIPMKYSKRNNQDEKYYIDGLTMRCLYIVNRYRDEFDKIRK